MLKTTLRPLAAALAVALIGSLALAAPAMAGDDEEKVRIKKIHHVCDGEDCEHHGEHHGEHKAVFIGEGGELHEIGELMGGDVTWVEAGDHGVHVIGGSGTFLGVQLSDLTDELRAHFGAPEGQGVMVSKVVEDSPAARAGVRVGDVITAVDGEVVESGGSLGRLIRGRDEGETVALEVYRDGRVERLSPTLAKREGGPMMGKRVMIGGPHGAHGGIMDDLRKVTVKCDEEDGEKDCEVTIGDGEAVAMGDFDCGGAEDCRVEVRCEEDGCECTANGEAVDCDELPGFSERHGG